MVNKTPYLNLNMPDETEFYDVNVANENAQIIDACISALGLQLGNITLDCGTFEDEQVEAHNADAHAHPNILAYGGTLEEHLSDPLAHDNIILDGNIN